MIEGIVKSISNNDIKDLLIQEEEKIILIPNIETEFK